MPPGGHTKSWQCFALCVVLRHWSISCKTFHQLINHYVQRKTDTVAFILPTNHASKVCTQTATSGTKVFDGVSVSRQKTQEMWHFLNKNIRAKIRSIQRHKLHKQHRTCLRYSPSCSVHCFQWLQSNNSSLQKPLLRNQLDFNGGIKHDCELLTRRRFIRCWFQQLTFFLEPVLFLGTKSSALTILTHYNIVQTNSTRCIPVAWSTSRIT